MKKQGFTLVELLAVIIILGIIMAITVPSVRKVIKKSTRDAFIVDAKNILKIVDFYLLEEEDPSLLKDLDNPSIKSMLNINYNNYQIIQISFDRYLNPFIKIVGKNKWENLMACGTSNDLEIGFDLECDVPPFPDILPNGQLCGSVFYDSRDGNKYKTLQIGTQCWFAENLRYTGGCLTDKKAIWSKKDNNDEYLAESCMIYTEQKDYQQTPVPDWAKNKEVLYQWGAVMNGEIEEGSQGLCPIGWHIPSDYEWKVFEAYIDTFYKNPNDNEWGKEGEYRGKDAGKSLKSIIDDWDGTDIYGFNARPAGGRIDSGTLYGVGDSADWWSSTAVGSDAWRRNLNRNQSGIDRVLKTKAFGRGARCVRD